MWSPELKIAAGHWPFFMHFSIVATQNFDHDCIKLYSQPIKILAKPVKPKALFLALGVSFQDSSNLGSLVPRLSLAVGSLVPRLSLTVGSLVPRLDIPRIFLNWQAVAIQFQSSLEAVSCYLILPSTTTTVAIG